MALTATISQKTNKFAVTSGSKSGEVTTNLVPPPSISVDVGAVISDVTAQNIGTLGEGVFVDKLGNTLRFKNVAGGTGIDVTSDVNNNIIVSANTDVAETDILLSCTVDELVGDVVYLSGSDVATRANASSIATGIAIGFIINKPNTTSCIVRTVGITTSLIGLTAGQTYFLDENDGQITTTPIAGAGKVLFPVGIAISSNKLLITTINQDYTIRA